MQRLEGLSNFDVNPSTHSGDPLNQKHGQTDGFQL